MASPGAAEEYAEDASFLPATPSLAPPPSLFGSPLLTSPPPHMERPFGGLPTPSREYRRDSGDQAGFSVGGFTSPSAARPREQEEYENDFEGDAAAEDGASSPGLSRGGVSRVHVLLEAPSPGIVRQLSRPNSRGGLPTSRPASRGATAVQAAPTPNYLMASLASSAGGEFTAAAAPALANGAASPTGTRATALAAQVEARFGAKKQVLPRGASPIAVLNAQRDGTPVPATPRAAPIVKQAPQPTPGLRSPEQIAAQEVVDSALGSMLEAKVKDRLRKAEAAHAAALEEHSKILKEHYTVLLAAKDKSKLAVEKKLKATTVECEALKARLANESFAGRVTALETTM